MKQIGFIEEERLKNIPKKYRARHEFCFYLHDLMVSLLIQMEIQKAGHIRFDIKSDEERKLLESGMHILDFLSQSGRGDIERRAVINHLCVALYADMLHYIYEGLKALEKRKFTVAFTLFRKPCKEGLLIAAQMCADEEVFFGQMKSNVSNVLNRKIWDESNTELLLESALQKSCSDSILRLFSGIYKVLFDRKNINGLAGLFDKATHLVTDYSHIQTENYNNNG